MKTKIVVFCLCYFFWGIIQNTIRQTHDSLGRKWINVDSLQVVKKDTAKISLDTIPIIQKDSLLKLDTVSNEQQLASLKKTYQEKQKELIAIQKRIDSLQSIINKPVVVAQVTDNKKESDIDEKYKIPGYDFMFTVSPCKIIQDTLFLTVTLKNLEGAKVMFLLKAAAYEESVSETNRKGGKSLNLPVTVSSNEQQIPLQLFLQKKDLETKKGKLKVTLHMRFLNGSDSKYQKYLEKNIPPFNQKDWNAIKEFFLYDK